MIETPGYLPTEALFPIVVDAMFTKNFLLVMFLGLCSYVGLTTSSETSKGMSMAVTFVMTMSAILTWPIFYYLLKPNKLMFLQTICFILVIASFVQLVEFIIHRYSPALYRSLGIYLPLISTNCAVLGVVLLNVKEDFTYGASIVYAFGAGLGYSWVMLATAAIREKLIMRGVDRFSGFIGAFFAAMMMALIVVSYFGVVKL
ncbi:electron transport complex subunit RsxA [ANME-2 cluster archaeon]|nr:electron transport complex subunit RsxA [Methanosarcinales archaeon]RJS68972.1 MAG: electron transport complex subunit RsxA [ANME-2 cluster archaeon]RLG21314.1 MAG: electron transport complex subunit RsxA [Methanosarcinales archaeon]